MDSENSLKKIAIILPAYNEAMTVSDTIRGFHAELPNAEIWIVDNNSQDNTGLIARQTLEALSAKGGVIEERAQGKGNALRRAFHTVTADIYILSDADSTYPSDQVRDLLNPVLEGTADMVVGDRHANGQYKKENKRDLHNFGNMLVRKLVNGLFSANLGDIMSGYRVVTRHFVKNYPILVAGFQIETDMTLHALDKRFRILEVPVRYKDRPSGSVSKLRTLEDGLRVLITIANILRYHRPLIFFSGFALLIALLGFAAGAPVILDFIQDGYIDHVPLAILATGLEVVSILLVAVGLILDSINHQDRRRAEKDLMDSNI